MSIGRIKWICFLSVLFLQIVSLQARNGSPWFGVEQTDRKCMVRMSREMLDWDFTVAARVETLGRLSGRLKLSSGQRLYEPVWIKLRLNGKQLEVIKWDEKNMLASETSSGLAYTRNTEPGVWKVCPVGELTDSTLLADWGSFFLDLLEKVDPFQGRTMPGKLVTSETKLLGASATASSLEVRVSYAFEQEGVRIPVVIRKSLRILPRTPMIPRLADSRINYGSIQKVIYHADRPAIEKKSYMVRFRLLPSRQVSENSLSEPVNPIVFYVDSCFPKRWIPAIKAGIEDWNKAFEQIGFKHAVVARDYPSDKEFDAYASGINCVRYIVSDFPNAMGKYWCDPRSGEILESDVLFYSSVIDLLKRWYFLQTASYNPVARNKELPDSVMNRLIRYAVAHEVGHCLGLEHNFKASFAYNIDSLRNRDFTDKWGSTPSIMDYARMNYVAQPGDGVTNVYPPFIGQTDMFAIKVGYQYMKYESDSTVSEWINAAQHDPLYWYDKANPSAFPLDPSVMQTDVGNNPRVSGKYGIANLRYLLAHIPVWNRECANPFDGMPASYNDLVDAYFNYLDGMVPWIAGTYKGGCPEPGIPKETVYVTASESEQTVEQLLEELKEGYRFLIAPDVATYAGSQEENIVGRQKKILSRMMDMKMFEHLAQTASVTGYGIREYLEQLSGELLAGLSDNVMNKNLCVNYLSELSALMQHKSASWLYPVIGEEIYTHVAWLKKHYAGKNKTIDYYINSIFK